MTKIYNRVSSIRTTNRKRVTMKFPPALYRFNITFAGNLINEPLIALEAFSWFINEGTVSSGTNIFNGNRDFSFEGSEKHIKLIMRYFRNSHTFRIINSNVELVCDAGK